MITPHLLEKKAAHLFSIPQLSVVQTFFDVNRLFLNFRRKDDLQFLRQRFDGICDVECFIFTHAYI